MQSLAGWALAIAILALVLAGFLLSLEWLKKPRLSITVAKPSGVSGRYRLLHVRVVNRDLPEAIRWLTQRRAVLSCRAEVAFYEEWSDRLLFEFSGRWVGNPQTMSPALVAGSPLDVFGGSSVPLWQRMEIPPGGEEELGIAVKYQGERECYGWGNESYTYPQLKNPKWVLKEVDCYTVRVGVSSGNLLVTKSFILHNEGPGLESFYLEEK